MGVKVRQKDGTWYVCINHHGRRKAKGVGDSKRAAEEVKRKLEAKSSATSALTRLSWLVRRHSPPWSFVAPAAGRGQPGGSTPSIDASVPWQGCASIVSTTCGTVTRPSSSMSTMPPCSTCQSNWGMPASR